MKKSFVAVTMCFSLLLCNAAFANEKVDRGLIVKPVTREVDAEEYSERDLASHEAQDYFYESTAQQLISERIHPDDIDVILSSTNCYTESNWTETLADLENLAHLIVKAEVLPGRKNYFLVWSSGFTSTPIKVTKVYSVAENTPMVKEGDMITIKEPFYVYEDEDGKREGRTTDKYLLAKTGEEYIFFLTYDNSYESLYPEEVWSPYRVLNSVLGRYPVLDTRARSFRGVEMLTEDDFDIERGSEYFPTAKKINKEIVQRYY